MRRTLLLLTALTVTVTAEGPLMTREPLDLWDPMVFPFFVAELGYQTPSGRLAFPGLDKQEEEQHMLEIGKRSASGSSVFGDLYVVDERGGPRTAGVYLGGIDFASVSRQNQLSANGLQRTWLDTSTGSWGIGAWYAPERDRVVKGFSLWGSDRRNDEYRITEDSLFDIGWERTIYEKNMTSGRIGAAALLALPWKGRVRTEASLSGSFVDATGWFQPADTTYAESYAASRRNTLRLDIQLGYLRHNPDRRSQLLVNLGLQSGGYRTTARADQDSSWDTPAEPNADVDSTGLFLECSYGRAVQRGPFEAFYATAGYWQSVFDKDRRDQGSGLGAFTTSRRTDRGSLALPVYLRVWLGSRTYLYGAWKPAFVYERSLAGDTSGNTSITEDARLVIDEYSLGICFAPVDKLIFAVTPVVSGGVVATAVEVRVEW